MIRISITEEMKNQAKIESGRRDAHIQHHFDVGHLTNEQRDELGFLGEFACSLALKQDWKANIRDNYHTIDDYDFIVRGKRIDVKSETCQKIVLKRFLQEKLMMMNLMGEDLFTRGNLVCCQSTT
jgi:hypothetical protein